MTKYESTVKLLKEIARRCAAREECKGTEYRVTITTTAEGRQVIEFDPSVLSFPTTFERKRINKDLLVKHACLTLGYDCRTVNKSRIVIDDEEGTPFLNGIYVYKLSFDKKRRAWFKI